MSCGKSVRVGGQGVASLCFHACRGVVRDRWGLGGSLGKKGVDQIRDPS
jgi:hypothetical protein